MVMLTKKAVVAAKLETTAGTINTPTAAANALQVWDCTFKPEGEIQDRDIWSDNLEKDVAIIGAKKCTVSFTTELKSNSMSGAGLGQGTAPRLGTLLRACGMVESATAETSSGDLDGQIDYSTRAGSMETCTIFCFEDGRLKKASGCRGSFDLNLNSGKFGEITFNFSGQFHDITDVALPSPTFEVTKPQLARGQYLYVESYTPCMNEFTLSAGNQIVERPCFNASEGISDFLITDREPTFTINPDAATEAVSSLYQIWAGNTTQKLSLTVGATAGNIIDVVIPQAQFTDIDPTDMEGLRKDTISGRCTDDGTNDYSILFTFR